VYLVQLKSTSDYELTDKNRIYALKIVFSLQQRSKKQLKQFCKNEYSLQMNLDSQFTVPVITYFIEQLDSSLLDNDWDVDPEYVQNGFNTLFVLMDLYDSSLKNRMKKYLSKDDVLCYMIQILNSIIDIQSHNIVHRDIKADNFLYNTAFNYISLADFGTAVKLRDDMKYNRREIQWDGYNVGMAPEILEESLEYIDGSKIDIYSIGILFSEMLNMVPNHDTSYGINLIGDLIDEDLLDIIDLMKSDNPDNRISAQFAKTRLCRHLWFDYSPDKFESLENWKELIFEQLSDKVEYLLEVDDLIKARYIISCNEEGMIIEESNEIIIDKITGNTNNKNEKITLETNEDEVHQWFTYFDNGKYSKWASNVEGLSGQDIISLNREDLGFVMVGMNSGLVMKLHKILHE